MNDFLVVVTLPPTSGIATDAVQNNWVVTASDPPTSGLAAAINTPMAAFYNNISGYFSQAVSRVADAVTFDYYDITDHLDGSPHGSPFASGVGTLAAAGSTVDFPSEVASCLTLHAYSAATAPPVEQADGADPGGAVDRPRQRKTGRVYLGTLNQNASAEDANNQPRPSSTFRNAVLTHVTTLNTALVALSGVNGLSVWSRANAFTYQVEQASMDDAFDTQRRRGVDPTTRTYVSL